MSSLGPVQREVPRLTPWLITRALTSVLVLALLAASCTSSGSDAIAVPTPERETPGLLPPTPQDAGTAEEQATEGTGLVPVATPTPRPPTLSCVPLRSRIAQLLLPLGYQSDMPQAIALAAQGDLGGFGLLGSPDSGLASLLADMQAASFVPVLVASDEEGGSVQRLANLLGPMPSAATSATTQNPLDVEAAWLEYGARVKALGIDVIFGPVLDVGSAPGIGSRSFGDEAVVVTAYGRAVAQGLTDAGVLPVFKHFPGHGRATGDSHLGLPLVPELNELWTSDLIPYVELVGDHKRDDVGVMIGHLSVPGLTGDLPTSLSPETVNGLLKNQIGFGGLVFTDALNMGAIVNTYGALEALELAFVAGSDIAILGSLADLEPALDFLMERADADIAFAALLDNRIERVMEAKGQTGICVGAQ